MVENKLRPIKYLQGEMMVGITIHIYWGGIWGLEG